MPTEPVAAVGEEDDALLHQAGRRWLLPQPEGGLREDGLRLEEELHQPGGDGAMEGQGPLPAPPPRWLPLHCRLQVTISTTDRRNNKLIFKVNLVEMESKILVDFRLSKVGAGGGCEVGAQRARGRLQGKCKAVQGGARRVQGGCKVLHSGCKVVHGGVQCGAQWVQGTEPLSLPVQGDGLEFKRHFLKIKGKLSDIVSTQKVWAPVT